MTDEPLEALIASAQHRLDNLVQQAEFQSLAYSDRSVTEGGENDKLLQMAIAEISTSLEELQVLAEELHQQNEELLATRQTVETERQRYQDLFHFAPEGYLVTDGMGLIQEANQAVPRLLKLRPKYLIGKPIGVFIAPDDRAKLSQALQQLRQGKKVTATEFQIYHAEGHVSFVAELSATAMRHKAGKKISFLWLLRDISERLNMESERRQAAERELQHKDILLREIHHRVKNNLQMMSSLLQMQEKRFGTIEPKVKELFANYQNRIQAMALIHRRFWIDQDLALVNFSEYIQILVANLLESYGSSPGAVMLNIETVYVELPLDTAMLLGMVTNELITNIFKYAFPAGTGEIIIRLTASSSALHVVIADNGIGLPAGSDIETMSSVGMSIVRALTKQLRGTIAFTQTEMTTFDITIPLEMA